MTRDTIRENSPISALFKVLAINTLLNRVHKEALPNIIATVPILNNIPLTFIENLTPTSGPLLLRPDHQVIVSQTKAETIFRTHEPQGPSREALVQTLPEPVGDQTGQDLITGVVEDAEAVIPGP